jgi:hypothetical protein
MVPVILPNNTLTTQLPQPRKVIRTRRNKIRRVRTECTVPHPSLVSLQRHFQRESLVLCCRGPIDSRAGLLGDVVFLSWLHNWQNGTASGTCGCVDGPYSCGVVGAAGGEVVHVGGEEDARDVCAVGAEFADGDEGCYVVGLDHAPDEYSALVKLDVSKLGPVTRAREKDVQDCSPRITMIHH